MIQERYRLTNAIIRALHRGWLTDRQALALAAFVSRCFARPFPDVGGTRRHVAATILEGRIA